jgi:hypothetical protein
MQQQAGAGTTGERPALSVPLRPPDQIMRLRRLGAFHATRLSFMRAMLRRVASEGWKCTRPIWRMDEKGVGAAVYEAAGPSHVYSLVAFGHELPPEKRVDRVIAEEWDATFTLFDGRPTEADLLRLAENVPKQEAGRVSEREIVLLRANRSVRLFDHVVSSLALGRQPESAEIDRVGYLMRTTAVYGSGKFGLADRERFLDRPELCGPYRAEMLAVWLTRAFTTDWVEHLARARNPWHAVPFDRTLRRRLGVGNSTGLGMTWFVINHPTLFSRWIEARETALARVRSEHSTTPEIRGRFVELLNRARAFAASWRVDDPEYTERIAGLERDLAAVADLVATGVLDRADPWNALYEYAEEQLGLDAQEMVVTLLLEPNGALVDDLADAMGSNEQRHFAIDGSMSIATLRALIDETYNWALGVDYLEPRHQARFWYTSVEKLEPRLGERFEEDGSALEQPFAIGRDMARLRSDSEAVSGALPVADFLARHPEHRHIVRRLQSMARHPYQEVRDNLIGAEMRPIDVLRSKLSFFGAQRFDPKSDRFLRVSLFPFAPFPDEIDSANADDWAFPPMVVPVTRAITVSLGEIDATVKKAARGTGYAWGLAEEAGRAVRWLESRGLPGLNVVLRHLESGTVEGSPIVAGIAFADRAHELASGKSLSASDVAFPLLLLPFAATASELSGRAIDLRWPGAQLRVMAGAATFSGRDRATAPGPVRVELSPAAGTIDGRPLVERIAGITVDHAVWSGLDRFAMKTYVPASKTSRIRGAGAGADAGDSDND